MTNTARPGFNRSGVAPDWIVPSLSDFFFFALIVWLFLLPAEGWGRLLEDGDSGWHIRTGQWILENRAVPFTDLFSFSKPGEPWFAWEWGAEILFGALYNSAGLKGVVLLSGVLIAACGTVLFRYSIWRGANGLVAVAASMLAVGASSLHYLARPHLFTLVLVPVAMWMIEADRRRPSNRIWLLVPLAILWTNLHGGFLVLLSALGLVAAGTLIESWWAGEGSAWSKGLRYAGIAAACAAATLVNPYGWRLHAHIYEYLRSDWIKEAIQEFQSPVFRSENMRQFEILLFAGLMAAASYLFRRRAVEALLMLFWAHQALTSARHVTVYATLAAPVIASELSRFWDMWAAAASQRSVGKILHSMGADMRSSCLRMSLWPAAVVVLLASAPMPLGWPSDFPESKFPISTMNSQAASIRGARLLTTDQWADYAIFRFWPEVSIFIDGRSDFFGRTIGNEYVRMSHANPDWRSLMGKYAFDAALIPPDWPLASVLRQDPDWKLLQEDKKALFFQRVNKDSSPLAAVPAPDRGKIRGGD